jgi:hypothetical protein
LGIQKLFSIAVLSVCSATFLVGQVSPAPEVEHLDSIQSRAAAAKAAGKTEVSFPAPGVSYPFVPAGLVHASSEFSVVVGIPVAKQTVVENDTSISTWYSIEIEQTISNRPCKMCSLLTLEGLPKSLQPSSLLPIPAHSMLLIRRGGTITADGVAVTETEGGLSALTTGKKYLFVVDKSPKGMVRLVLNDAGIFAVGDDGDTLTPITPASHPPVSHPSSTKVTSLKELRQSVQPPK